MALSTSKAALRKEILAKVSSLSVEERARQSDVVQAAVLNSKAFKYARHVSVYLSLPKEVSTNRIVDSILSDSSKVLYAPDIIHGGESAQMEMLQVFSKDDLGHFESKELGVKCPTHDKVRVNPLSDMGEGLDLIIVPGIAFDDKGGRLGRGKGYYDHYFEKVKAAHKKLNKPMPELIALAFDEQVVDAVPTGPKDYHVDHVMHPKIVSE